MTEPKDTAPPERSAWRRLPYLLLFGIVFKIVEVLVCVIALVQFVLHVALGRPNERLRSLGTSLSAYVREIAAYLTYARDTAPYPFGPWPSP
jgi:hypothetical protein